MNKHPRLRLNNRQTTVSRQTVRWHGVDGNRRMRDFKVGPLLDKTKQTTETPFQPPNSPQSKRTEMTTPHELNE